jgi:hypothetical protein
LEDGSASTLYTRPQPHAQYVSTRHSFLVRTGPSRARQNRTRAASSRLSQAPRLLLPRAWTGRRVRLQPTAIASDGDERPFCPPQPECDAATADHDLANERARPLLAACGCDQLKVTAHRFHSLLRQSRDGVAVQQRHYPTT